MATKRRGRKPAAKKSASTSRITFSKWDVADYLRTEEDIVAYFDVCLDEAGDDPSFIAAALGDIARARGMSRVARDSGLTREGLYRALARGANPSLGTVLKVTRALGLKLRAEAA
jgi:probable addiction module antidote protein